MAKSKRSPKKESGKPKVSVEEQLALALSDKAATKAEHHAAARRPQVGDRVKLEGSETVFLITKALPNSKDVNLQFPGSNIERFRVPIEDLTFVDGPQAARSPAEPAKPEIDVEEVKERLSNVRHSSQEQLEGDIAILTKYFRGAGVPAPAIEELQRLRRAQAESWENTVEAISKLLEDYIGPQ